MATNPMQRKANNSFLLGMLITLLISGVIIGLLFLQLSKVNKEKKAMEANMVKAYVLNKNVKSGQLITTDMLKEARLNSETIPASAITATKDLNAYSLCDENGNAISSYSNEKGESGYVIQLADGKQAKLVEDTSLNQYYYEVSNNGNIEKKYVTFSEEPIIAKVDLDTNTLLTTGTISRGEKLSSDVRKQEYNVITLPSQIEDGEYIDVRLRLPTGQDYIVVSHKQVKIPAINGVYSQNCIWINLSEIETLSMSSAIVEAYRMNGAKIYATKYVEAGLQDAATETYLPSNEVMNLIAKNPNIVQEAKNTLFKRNNDSEYKAIVRNPINNAKNNEDADDNLNKGVQEEIQGLQEEREKYLESLGE